MTLIWVEFVKKIYCPTHPSVSTILMSPSIMEGHRLDEWGPLKHFIADFRSNLLILHLIQFRALL